MFLPTLLVALYFVPALLASSRRHPSAAAIGVCNLLLGWTLIGWVVCLVCLVWALAEPRCPVYPTYLPPAVIVANTPYAAGWSPASASPAEPHCRACARPVLPGATFCTMCGANLVLRP